MNLQQAHIENLRRHYQSLADSDEQPASVRAHYKQAIARLQKLKNPTVADVEAFIDTELMKARSLRARPVFRDAKKQHREAEKATKFRIGLPGISADRWVEKPDLPPCCHAEDGDKREWHIADGKHYQEQLYCTLNRAFINPSGFTCELCCRRKQKVAGMGKKAAADWIIRMVERKEMTRWEAYKLVRDNGLESS